MPSAGSWDSRILFILVRWVGGYGSRRTLDGAGHRCSTQHLPLRLARSAWPLQIPAQSMLARANLICVTRSSSAMVSTNQRTPAKPGSIPDSRVRDRLAASSSIRKTRTSSSWRPWVTLTGRIPIVGSFVHAMAARPGRKCSLRMTMSERSISLSIQLTHTPLVYLRAGEWTGRRNIQVIGRRHELERNFRRHPARGSRSYRNRRGADES